MSVQPASSATRATDASKILPYSFIVKYKDNVPASFKVQYRQKVKRLCQEKPRSSSGVTLPGITVEFKELFEGFGGQFHPDVVKAMTAPEVSRS